MCDMCLSFETGRKRWVGSTNSVSSKWLKKERKGRYMVVEPPPSLLASCTFFTTILLLLLLLHCLDVEVFSLSLSLSSYPHTHMGPTPPPTAPPLFLKKIPSFFFSYFFPCFVTFVGVNGHLAQSVKVIVLKLQKNYIYIVFFFVSKKHVVCWHFSCVYFWNCILKVHITLKNIKLAFFLNNF